LHACNDLIKSYKCETDQHESFIIILIPKEILTLSLQVKHTIVMLQDLTLPWVSNLKDEDVSSFWVVNDPQGLDDGYSSNHQWLSHVNV